MYVFIGLLIALAIASVYLWMYRTAIFSKVILGVGVFVSAAGELASQLGLFDWSSVLPSPYAGLMTLAVLVVGFLARFTTAEPEA